MQAVETTLCAQFIYPAFSSHWHESALKSLEPALDVLCDGHEVQLDATNVLKKPALHLHMLTLYVPEPAGDVLLAGHV